MTENWKLISKFLSGEASEDECSILNAWMDESYENQQKFLEVKKSLELFDHSCKENIEVDKQRAWASIQRKIHSDRNIVNLKPAKKTSASIFLKIAAILVIGLFAAWGLYRAVYKREQVHIVAQNGKKELKLQDGSIVWLNTKSDLSYPQSFNGKYRKVRLNSEAYFEVSKNVDMPFVIENDEFSVVVLGTAFNIFSYEKENEIRVNVLSGSVSFKDKFGTELLLLKGETGILNKTLKMLTKEKSGDPNFLAWKEERLEFTNAPFSYVCRTSGNYFGYNFILKSKELENIKYTGTFEKPTLDGLLEVLKNTLNIEVAKHQSTKEVVISSGNMDQ